jgi:hypothetical protein
MKKVIFNDNKTEIVEVKNVNTSKYYGVLISDTREKGFIGKMTVGNESRYTLFAAEGFTEGNGWSCFKSDTLRGLFEVLKGYSKEMYEFDTFWDLMDWMKKKGE